MRLEIGSFRRACIPMAKQAPDFCGRFRPGVLATSLLHPSYGVGGHADVGRPLRVKLRNVLQLLHADGWRLVAVEGSHRQFKRPAKPGRVTGPGHPSAEVPPGALNSILKKAGLR